MQNSPQNCIGRPGPKNEKIEVLKLYIKTLRENKIIPINRIIIKIFAFLVNKLNNQQIDTMILKMTNSNFLII